MAMAAAQEDALLLVWQPTTPLPVLKTSAPPLPRLCPPPGGTPGDLGVTPTAPETGYGYIEADPGTDEFGLHPVRRFVEKPDRERAEAFLAQGNSIGTVASFCFVPGVMVKELERCAPDVLHAARASLRQAHTDLDFLRLESAAFCRSPRCPLTWP